jgi:hypothetical protein
LLGEKVCIVQEQDDLPNLPEGISSDNVIAGFFKYPRSGEQGVMPTVKRLLLDDPEAARLRAQFKREQFGSSSAKETRDLLDARHEVLRLNPKRHGNGEDIAGWIKMATERVPQASNEEAEEAFLRKVSFDAAEKALALLRLEHERLSPPSNKSGKRSASSHAEVAKQSEALVVSQAMSNVVLHCCSTRVTRMADALRMVLYSNVGSIFSFNFWPIGFILTAAFPALGMIDHNMLRLSTPVSPSGTSFCSQ